RIVFERPYDKAAQAMRQQPFAGGGEEPRAEPYALAFRLDVELVDLAFLAQLTRPVAADRGIAGDLAAHLHDVHRGRAADRIGPPVASAPAQHGIERAVRDDARIGALPRSMVDIGDGLSIADLSLADADRDRGHDLLTIATRRADASAKGDAGSDLHEMVVEFVAVVGPIGEMLGEQRADRGDRRLVA